MPSKDDKIKNEAPKTKNFFDLDEDDGAEVVAEQPAQKSTRITNDRLKDLGASMRNIFHEENEDDLFEDKEEEEIKVSEQQQKATSKEERREQLRTEFPQHFYDGGAELNHVVSKTEIKPVQEPVENPEPAKVEEDNSTITAAEQTATVTERTEISNDRLKEIGAAMRDIFHEENEDDLFEEKDEEQVKAPEEQQKKASTKEERREELKAEHPQHFYDGNTALNDVMPKSEPEKTEEKPEKAADKLYEINETVVKINENESVKSHVVNMPKFYNLWDKRSENQEVFEQVRADMVAIYSTAGFKDQKRPYDLLKTTYENVHATINFCPTIDGRKANMHEVATQFFIESYNTLEKTNLDPKDKAITAQRIADLMIKNYSPVTFAEGKLDQYADNYALNNTELLKQQLEKQDMTAEEKGKLMQDVDVALGRAPEKKQEPAKKYSIFGDGPEDEDEENELEIVSNLDFLTKNQNEATTPETTREDALNKLRTEVFTNKGINQEEEEKELTEAEEEKELTEAEEILYKMEHDRIKAAQPKEKAPNESSPTFTIEHVKNMAQILEVEEDDEPALVKKPVENPTEKKEDSKEIKEDKKDTSKSETKPEEKNAKVEKINDSANVAIFINKLNTFNNMYKLKINANDFAFSVTESWTKMSAADEKQKGEGKQMLQDLFKDTLKQAFDVEKDVSYDEHRLPDYNEIIKSSNELLRVAMFAFTDLYHNPKSASFFERTAFGGMNAKDMAELTSGESLWSMDQKTDEAWDIQSKEAKDIADKWLGERKPYETMINEMNALVEANKNGILDRKEILNKLAAAEWLLLNNEKMMVENPEDPINPIPNWGNRYWKALTSTREALGIDKHISMRELIQGDYAASAKAANNKSYTETQIKDYVLDPEARAIYDSMDVQKEQFATQSAAVVLSEPQKEKSIEDMVMEELRVKISIKSEDQREIMKNEPKDFSRVVDNTAEVKLDGPQQGGKV